MTNTRSAVQKSNTGQSMPAISGDQLQIGRDLLEYAKQFAREKPEVAALYCFGIGFILGWKLKPW
jgi:hypothetical protein